MGAVATVHGGRDWLQNADQFLSGARVKINVWGSRILRSDSTAGSVSLKRIVSNVQTVAVRDCLHGPGLTKEERLQGMQVARKLRELYVVSHDLKKECSLFTRICLFVRDLLFGSGSKPVELSSMPAPLVGNYGPSYVERTFGCYTASQYQTTFGRLAPILLSERPKHVARVVLSESYLNSTINPLKRMAVKGKSFLGQTRTLSIIGIGVLANYSVLCFNGARARGHALLARARTNPRVDAACVHAVGTVQYVTGRVNAAWQYSRAQITRGYQNLRARAA